MGSNLVGNITNKHYEYLSETGRQPKSVRLAKTTARMLAFEVAAFGKPYGWLSINKVDEIYNSLVAGDGWFMGVKVICDDSVPYMEVVVGEALFGNLQKDEEILNTLTVKIKKLHQNAVIPTYAHGPDEDAGFDLRAVEPAVLRPLVPTLVKTGLSIELPSGFEAQIRSRSGLALKQGLFVLNSPGTVDPSYRGEVGVILLWTGYKGDTGRPDLFLSPGNGLIINEGDRIAQMVVAKYEPVTFVETAELSDSDRGAGGFGSTGKQ